MPTDTDDRTSALLAAQVDDYARLSRRYAARGDTRRAVLAAWAADVRAVQALLWEAGLSDAPDPELQLRAVAGAVETVLLGRDLPAEVSPRDLLEDARRALAEAFDESVHALLAKRFVGLDHLDGLPAPMAGAANLAVAERFDGRGAENLVGGLLAAAGDARVVADVMAAAGEAGEARRQDNAADLAAFEAYLVLASAASGDATLATTDLRWELAASQAGSARDAILSAVAPAEQEALLSVLDAGRGSA